MTETSTISETTEATETPVFSHTLHKQMWEWISENPRRQEKDFISSCNISRYRRQALLANGCSFACEYARTLVADAPMGSDLCRFCPLVCEDGGDWCLGGLVSKWSELREVRQYVIRKKDAWERLEAVQRFVEEKMRDVALQIANLPVREGVITN